MCPEVQFTASESVERPALEPIWWGRADDLRCGHVKGTIHDRAWQWRVSSEDAVWLWLNLKGEGLIWGDRDRFPLKPGMYAMTGGSVSGSWTCLRHPGEQHLHWVVISRTWLERRLENQVEGLRPGLAEWLAHGGPVAFCGLMGIWERDLAAALVRAISKRGPTRLLAEARLLEWTAARWFHTHATPGPQCAGTSPGADTPVKRAIQWLRENLDQPLDLAKLSKAMGISPHHLSRKVSEETGMTLSRHLRRLRIETACDSLTSGKMNVTEAALEVGYQSLSHFAKAFREEMGKPPMEWLAAIDGRSGV